MKKILSALMAATMLASLSVSAFAAEVNTDGGTGSADAVLTAEAVTFSVTVPAQLPINVDAAGVVTTATDAKIVNNSPGAVKVNNVVFTPVTEWTAVSFDKDMSAVKVGSREVGFKINECKTDDTGALLFDATKFPSIAAMNDGDTDESILVYDAIIPAQKTAIANAKIADVVFTIDWDEAASEVI